MAFPAIKNDTDAQTRTAPSGITPAFSRNARAFGGKKTGGRGKRVGSAQAFLRGLQGK